MTFEQDERSIDDSQPREGVELVFASATYRLATGVRSIVISGQTFKPATASRENVSITPVGENDDLEVAIIATHPAVQHYIRGGVPPKRVELNLYRLQLTSGEYQRAFAGVVQSVSLESNVAKFLVASRLADELSRRLPTITSGRMCPHILYGPACKANRAAHVVTRTIGTTNGRRIFLNSAPNVTNGWATYGMVLHVPSGEYVTIEDQNATTLVLQHPIYGAQSGDEVQVYAGCAHDIITCRTKFANQVNYGGQPHKPDRNPWLLGGMGVYESE